MKIKTGDIVKAKYGSVVFTFLDTVTGKREHLNIPPYGIVTEVNPKQKPDADVENIQMKIIFDATSLADYKEEDLEIICSTGLKSNRCKPTLEQIQREYHTSQVVMGEMLATFSADGLSIEDAFNLYIQAMHWAEGDRYYRQVDDTEMEEIEIK